MNDEYKNGGNLDPLEQCEGRYRMEDEYLVPTGCQKVAIVLTAILAVMVILMVLITFNLI